MENNCITIMTREEGKPLGDLFGIFFEDLNHAADGGLYPEMVQNRSFEFSEIDHPSYHALMAWEKVEKGGKVELSVKKGDAVSMKNPHYLHMEILEAGPDIGVKNLGFSSGMYIQKGKKYNFSCYARCQKGKQGVVYVSLRGENNRIIGESKFNAGDSWEKYELVLEAEETTNLGSLALTVTEKISMDFDFVSLFPHETFRGRKNGLRVDLAKALEELKPRFLRFPGGCLVHDGSLDENARDSMYRWKNTIGPLEDRPSRRSNWGYNQTLGLGYYEYFLFCEDIGAKPVPIVPAGYDPHHKREVPLEELGPWIEETLDLIEFANGDTTTKWGSIRAELGHDHPFNLEYIGIGNEEVGDGFRERFPYFVQAIREKYPDIKIIGSSGPFCGGSEYDLGWEGARENRVNLVDEHYYMSPEWFIANMHRYDEFSESEPNVFLGEYAAWSNTGKSALTEAAFMTQLQNAAHAVKMACYAPLLCHRDYENWKPDLIWFSNDKICKSVNYEVQKLFMNHQGDELLSYQLETDIQKEVVMDLDTRKQGSLYFWGDEAKVLFSNITLYNEDTGEEQQFSDREVDEDKIPVLLAENNPQNFTLKFRAKELKGYKGFRVYFAWKNEENRMSWVLGGWENQDAAFSEEIAGKGGFLTQNKFEVEQNREYELKLRVLGNKIEGWIDGKLFQSVELTPIEMEPLYMTVSRDAKTSDIIIKAVNLRQASIETKVKLPDLQEGTYLCEKYQLLEENCVENDDFPGVETAQVERVQEVIELQEENKGFWHCFQGRSVTVIRISKDKL